MIRTFLAVELGAEVRSALGATQQRLKESSTEALLGHGRTVRVQWVCPESTHVTLKFLGNVEESRIPDIEQAMSLVGDVHSSFSVEVGGVGAFPDIRRPRVLWVGVRDSEHRLTTLARDLDQALNEQGFPRETRLFRPHVTLVRIQEHARQVGQACAAGDAIDRDLVVGSLEVTALSLMKSEVHRSGALYTRLKQVSLKGA